MSRRYEAVVPEYEVIFYVGPLPALAEPEESPAERDFLDLQSNPRRRRDWAEWCRDARAAAVKRLGLKPRSAGS